MVLSFLGPKVVLFHEIIGGDSKKAIYIQLIHDHYWVPVSFVNYGKILDIALRFNLIYHFEFKEN